MKNLKAVLSVKFNSSYGSKELINLIHQDLELFKDVPGLVQKYYVAEEAAAAQGGIYIFESRDAREAFWSSDLAKSIPGRYGVDVNSIRIEKFDITFELNESVLA